MGIFLDSYSLGASLDIRATLVCWLQKANDTDACNAHGGGLAWAHAGESIDCHALQAVRTTAVLSSAAPHRFAEWPQQPQQHT